MASATFSVRSASSTFPIKEIRQRISRKVCGGAWVIRGVSIKNKRAMRTLVAGLVVTVAADLDPELQRMRATGERKVVGGLKHRVKGYSGVRFRITAVTGDTHTGNSPGFRSDVGKAGNPERPTHVLFIGEMADNRF